MENVEFEKNDSTSHLKFLTLQWGTKNTKFDNFNKKGSYRLKMTRGFQIWFKIQIEQLLIKSLFGQKTIENWQNPVFGCFFWPKRGQMLLDFNFETRFEILSSFIYSSLYDPFLLKLSNFEFLFPRCN